MKRVLSLVLLGATGLSSLAEEAPKFNNKQLDFFEKNIRPVLVDKCYRCHSPAEKVKGGLMVDSRDALMRGGDSGPALAPGNPAKSLLIAAISYQDEDLQMPPKERLTDEQIAHFKAWVRMGAPDPRKEAAAAKPFGVIDVNASREGHWAFQPIANPDPPRVADKDWNRHAIDRFVRAAQEEKNLRPNAAADKRTLIRRATYDLTGLPPTPEEVEDFVKDPSPTAFERVVDRLLKSPHYGERWGRHWLDVARYADTSGDRRNRGEPTYPFAWTYRDYVIKAFNEDKPFDRFIKEQIAADQLVDEEAKDRSPLAALGYLTVGKRFMGNANEMIDDQIDVVTQGFLGLTAACARCHDHKFDPVPQTDYYSLHGVFSSSEIPDALPYLSEPEKTEQFLDFQKKLAALETEYAAIRPNAIGEVIDELRGKAGEYLLASHEAGKNEKFAQQRAIFRKRGLNQNAAAYFTRGIGKVKEDHPVLGPWVAFAELPEKGFAPQARKLLNRIKADQQYNAVIREALVDGAPTSMKDVARIYGKTFVDIRAEWLKVKEKGGKKQRLGDAARDEIRRVMYDSNSPIMPSEREARRLINNATVRRAQYRLQPRLLKLKTEHPGSPARAMALVDQRRPRDSRLLIRGEARRFGDVVPRQFLEVLSPPGKREPYRNGSGRMELAEDIASRDNPLTARVIANRVWFWHFDAGIVESLSDFGLRCEKPLHKDLLDHLATWFMDNGWSIKKLHKHIMLSNTYQLSSEKRAEYEELDPGNQYFWKANLKRLDFESLRDSLLAFGGNIDLTLFGPSVEVTQEKGDYPTRRTVYGHVDRETLHELFRTFDFANPDMTTSRRMETTVPQQALFMMNSPLVIEQAKKLLDRSDVKSIEDKEERLRYLYQLLFQRDPSAKEVNAAWDFLEAQANKVVKASESDAWSYGYGTYDERNNRTRFQPMRGFDIDKYTVNRRFPDRRLGEALLTAQGGHACKDGRYAVIRRWMAPRDGAVHVTGKVSHQAEEGDGIQALIVSSRSGKIGEWKLDNDFANATAKAVDVKQGDTLDFMVLGGDNDLGDDFEWSPRIRMDATSAWDAALQFAAPRAAGEKPLDAWEKLAQILFLTNEMMYLN